MLIKKSKYLSNKINIVLIVLLYITSSIQHSPFFQGLNFDSEVFRYMGMLIANGGAPYLDAFDHKPPFIYIINFIGFVITPNNIWGTFIVLNFLGLSSVFLIYKLSKKITSSLNFSIATTFIYIGLINSPLLLEEPNLTRQLSVYLIVYLISIVFLCKKIKIKLFSSGIVFMLIFITQQNEILATIPIIFFVISNGFDFKKLEIKVLIVDGMIFIVGLTTVGLLMFSLIYYWGNFDAFLHQAFEFNMANYVQKETVVNRILNTMMVKKRIAPLAILLVLIVGYNIYNIKNIRKIQHILILTLIVQFFSTSLSGRAFGHYYLMFIPYLILLLIYTFKYFYRQLKWLSSSFIVHSFFIISLCVNIYFLFGLNPYQKNNIFANEVASVANKKGQFYSFDAHYLRLNYNYNIVCPSKWIYPYFAYTDYDPEGEIVDSIINDLEKLKTSYVLVNSKWRKMKKADIYLKKKYVPIIKQGDIILHLRKEKLINKD